MQNQLQTKTYLCIAFFLITFFTQITSVYALKVFGKLTDKSGNALPFATVVVKGTTQGTSTNLEGFYALNLPVGNYTIVYQYIGYQPQTKEVKLQGQDQEINVQLQESPLELDAITIRSNGEDPAYELIRQAQARRKYHLEEEINSYRCNIYTKIFERSTRDGGSINLFGANKQIKKGVFYLSETLSQLSFEQKNKNHELVLASKVSGDSLGYSYNRANWLNFYQNQALSMNTRSIISPIAEQAMQYYIYRLENIQVENGKKVYKIRLLPKYKSAPIFTGFLYLLDEQWNIHSIDAHIAPDVVSAFDSTSIRQVYMPMEGKNAWVPFSLTTYFQLYGGAVQAYYHAIATDYEVNIDFPKDFFGNELLYYKEDAGQKEEQYWEELRPIPLIQEEINDYQKYKPTAPSDSIDEFVIEDDLDTIPPKTSKKRIHWTSFVFGKTNLSMGEKTKIRLQPLLSMIGFNTIEGWRLEYNFDFTHQPKLTQELRFTPFFRYGFANEGFQSKLQAAYIWKKKPGSIRLEGGRYVEQLSGYGVISEPINAAYTLLRGDNYLKLYEKDFLEVQFSQEWFNGFSTSLGAEYAQRRPMVNNTDYKWHNRENINYTSNAPINAELPNTEFAAHEAITLHAAVKIAFRQEYVMRPTGKEVERVRGPELVFAYRKGLGDLDYDWLMARLTQAGDLGVLGRFKFVAEAGTFVNNSKLFFPDFQHFAGNRTFLLQENQAVNFQLMNYYQYSTQDSYLQGNFTHRFDGLLLSLIPGVRNLKLGLVLEVNYLYTEALPHYTEVGLGIDKILNFFRIDCYHSLNRADNSPWGVRLRIGRSN
jgi:hypothetical protein